MEKDKILIILGMGFWIAYLIVSGNNWRADVLVLCICLCLGWAWTFKENKTKE